MIHPRGSGGGQAGSPNIVTINEVGEHDGNPLFATQYIDNKALQAYK
jgi:hypothetical protein